MSLGGLAVAIGLIIDDTVVVIENIARHLAEGQPATSPWTGPAAISKRGHRLDPTRSWSSCRWRPVRGVVGQFFQSLSISPTVAPWSQWSLSSTIIPVLAARFRRPMPTTGPIKGNRLADVYDGLEEVRLRFREDQAWRCRRCWRSCRADPPSRIDDPGLENT